MKTVFCVWLLFWFLLNWLEGNLGFVLINQTTEASCREMMIWAIKVTIALSVICFSVSVSCGCTTSSDVCAVLPSETFCPPFHFPCQNNLLVVSSLICNSICKIVFSLSFSSRGTHKIVKMLLSLILLPLTDSLSMLELVFFHRINTSLFPICVCVKWTNTAFHFMTILLHLFLGSVLFIYRGIL